MAHIPFRKEPAKSHPEFRQPSHGQNKVPICISQSKTTHCERFWHFPVVKVHIMVAHAAILAARALKIVARGGSIMIEPVLVVF